MRMAEFCLDCLNRMNGTDEPSRQYILSKKLSLCEGCKKPKHVVLMERRYDVQRKFRFIIVPFQFAFSAFSLLVKIFIHKKK